MLGHARALAWRAGSGLWLVSATRTRLGIARRREELERVAAEIRDVPVEGITVDAEAPAGLVVRAVRDHGGLAVCVATRGRHPAAEAALGSVATSIVARSPVPVLVAGPGAGDGSDEPWFDNVVACIDGSRRAEAVVPVAARWAALLGAHLHLVQVMSRAESERLHRDGYPAWDFTSSSYDALESTGVPSSWEILHGEDPAREIARHIRHLSNPLVAMSTRGRSALHRAVVGSVANETVRRASCPVLLVRAEAADRDAAAVPA